MTGADQFIGNPKLYPTLIITASMLAAFLYFSSVSAAWTGNVHDYMCPDGYNIDCKIADRYDFQKDHPYTGATNHLCFDNRTDCMPRLVAEYYVKKYYVEGQTDQRLLGATAHLLQDSAAPDHWYPMRELFGRIFVPFAPNWVGTIENIVESGLSSKREGWGTQIDFQGKTVTIDKNYIDGQKKYIQDFLSKEPNEDIGRLEEKIKARGFWHWMRSFKEWVMVGLAVLAPLLAYNIWVWKRKAKSGKTAEKTDLIIGILALLVLSVLLVLIQLFY